MGSMFEDWQATFDAITDPLCLLDHEHRIVKYNRAMADLFAGGGQPLTGRYCFELCHGSAEIIPECPVSRMLQSHRRETAELTVRDRSYEVVADPYFDGQGRLQGAVHILRDITAKKQYEKKISERETVLQQILDTSSVAIFLVDRSGRITNANRRMSEMFRCPMTELIGSEYVACVHPAERERGRQTMLDLLASKIHSVDLERRYWRRDGTEFWGRLSGRRFHDDAGNEVGLVGVIADISEPKRAEEERRDLERQLIQAQRLDGLGVLAGGIAHDFNNLLQGVFGYISMARMTIDQKEKAIAMLEQAEQALHQSVGLSTQLLTFSKGGMPVKKELALGPVIRKNVQFALCGSRSDSELQVAADLRMVNADEGQIGQVIQNLVINADQAMPAGGRIVVTAENVRAPGERIPGMLAPGDYAVLTVKDSGVGMPPEHLPRIFDPYFTTKEKGSGLGLAISYSIVANHGGTIDVTSEPGIGSSFAVYLPACGGPAPSVQAAGQGGGGARKGNILVMDDEEVVRKVAGEMITALGHAVDCVAHGGEAITRYQQAREAGRPYDIVILDLTVRGGMGGAEAMKRLLEIDPGVKAVVSSGYADDSILADYQKHGFCATLGKPYMIKTLSSLFERLLSS